MLSNLLLDIEGRVPVYGGEETTPDQWQSAIDTFAPRVFELGDAVQEAVSGALGAEVFGKSCAWCLYNKQPSSIVSTFQLRPINDYYLKLNREIPAPENPNGPQATGIEFSVLVARASERRGGAVPAAAYVDFSIRGCNEREAFRNLLKDHRKLVELLVSKYNFEFSCAIPFDNLESMRSKSAFKMLEAYFQNEVDAEDTFTLTASFDISSSFGSLVRAAIPLATLYYLTEGYAQKRKEKVRAFKLLGSGKVEI